MPRIRTSDPSVRASENISCPRPHGRCDEHWRKHSLNKKFWEELMSYFPLIRNGLHRKQKNWGAHRQQGDLISLLKIVRGKRQTDRDQGDFIRLISLKNWGRHIDRCTDTDTQTIRQQVDLISLLLFFPK
jgi:hypothetical protein